MPLVTSSSASSPPSCRDGTWMVPRSRPSSPRRWISNETAWSKPDAWQPWATMSGVTKSTHGQTSSNGFATSSAAVTDPSDAPSRSTIQACGVEMLVPSAVSCRTAAMTSAWRPSGAMRRTGTWTSRVSDRLACGPAKRSTEPTMASRARSMTVEADLPSRRGPCGQRKVGEASVRGWLEGGQWRAADAIRVVLVGQHEGRPGELVLVAVHPHQGQASRWTALEARALPAQAERAAARGPHEQVPAGLRERALEQSPADQAQPAQRPTLDEHIAQRGSRSR